MLSCKVSARGGTGVVARIQATAPVYPLNVSSNGRYLVDQNGTPFFPNGDVASSLIAQLDSVAVQQYLDDRNAKGINTIWVELIEHAFANDAPNNIYGQGPFSGTLSGGLADFSMPNESYWKYVDYVLEQANARGITVLAFPAYCGYDHNNEGWAAEVNANGDAGLTTYGQYLGQRYAAQPNIIWVAGGDWGPVSNSYDLTTQYSALKQGIETFDTVHLWTAHANRNVSGVEAWGYLGLDVNTTYSTPNGTPGEVKTDYDRLPVMPFFYIEGYFENEHGTSVVDLHYQSYSTVLGGGFGSLYGACPLWHFDATTGAGFCDDQSPTWIDALNFSGGSDMAHLGDLIRSRPFEKLVPDYAHTAVTAGYGNLSDGTYAATALASDSSTLLVYIPQQRAVTVDLGQLSGTDALVWWYNPNDGSYTFVGSQTSTGSQDFTPPTTDDWVLVIDDSAAGYPPPGSTDPPLPVTQTAFDARVDGDHIQLTWSTGSESQFRGFEIQQRAHSQTAFDPIGYVESGNPDEAETRFRYDIEHRNPGQYAFRIKMVDLDGAAFFGPVIEVTVPAGRGTGQAAFFIDGPYPNPAEDGGRIRLFLREAQHVRIVMTDLMGRAIQTIFDEGLEADEDRIIHFSSDGLASGTYLLHINGTRFAASRAVAIIR